MKDIPPVAQLQEVSNSRKPSILLKCCRIILWCLAVLVVLGIYHFYQLNQLVHRIERREAMSMAIAISTGIDHFTAQYHTLPLPPTIAPHGSDTDTDSSSAHPFISILGGKEPVSATPQNPGSTNFLEGIKIANKDRKLFFLEETTGCYGIVDPWGTPYRIRLDTNNDKSILNPHPDQAEPGRATLMQYSIVWSAGRDRDWDTWDDNPRSWD